MTVTAVMPVAAGTPSTNPTANFAVIGSSGILGGTSILQTLNYAGGAPTAVTGIVANVNLSGVNGPVPAVMSMRIVAEGLFTPTSGTETPSVRVYETTSATPITTAAFPIQINFTDGTWNTSTAVDTRFTIYLYTS